METPGKRGTPAQGNIKTEYEQRNDLVSREELIKNVSKLMEELNDVDFHSYYHLLWTLSTQRMLERMEEKRKERGGWVK